jgi:hypothetical protein
MTMSGLGQSMGMYGSGASFLRSSGVRISQSLSTRGSSNRQRVYFCFTSLRSNAAFRRPAVNVTWRTSLTVTMN